jgi:predicted nucleic acid-binding protein
VSVVTLGELQLGVLSAPNDDIRVRRADTLALARTADPIPITEAVMVEWARLVADCRAAGIHRTVKLTDSLIAATAVEHGLTVVTQDEDFDRMALAHPGLRVLRV